MVNGSLFRVFANREEWVIFGLLSGKIG